MGVSFLYGVALSASLAVAVVVVASVTLLPALLAFVGRRVDRLRIPGLGSSLRTGGGTLATRWSRVVQRHAVVAAVAGSAVLLALAAPVLGSAGASPTRATTPTDPHARRLRARHPRLRPGRDRAAAGHIREPTSGRTQLAERMRGEDGRVLRDPAAGEPRRRAAVLTSCR